MSLTVTQGPGIITIVPDGSTDFDAADYLQEPVFVSAIKLQASAANDVIKVRVNAVGGPIVTSIKDVGGSGVKEADPFPAQPFYPFIKHEDCTFNTAASALIIITFTRYPLRP